MSSSMRNLDSGVITAAFIGRDQNISATIYRCIRMCYTQVRLFTALTGVDGLALVEARSPHVVLVHTSVQDMFVQVLVEELRRFSDAPLLVLSEAADETEAVTVLDLGADDYIHLPCGQRQMAARIRASLRRASMGKTRDHNRGRLVSGDLSIDPSNYQVLLGNQTVRLTPTEFKLLYLLARNYGKVVPHNLMGIEVWGDQHFTPALAKKHIQRLRGKLADHAVNPRWIASIYRVGYRFVGPQPRWLERNLPGNDRALKR